MKKTLKRKSTHNINKTATENETETTSTEKPSPAADNGNNDTNATSHEETQQEMLEQEQPVNTETPHSTAISTPGTDGNPTPAPQTSEKKPTNYLQLLNQIIFGLYGLLYGLTSLGGVLELLFKYWQEYSLGITSTLGGGISNAYQAPQSTRPTFENPKLFIATSVIAVTIAPYTGAIFSVSVLQALTSIEKRTSSQTPTWLKALLSNYAFVVSTFSFASGLVNTFSIITANISYKFRKDKPSQFFLMREYLNGCRTLDEYEKFDPNSDEFLNELFSWKNILSMVLATGAGQYLGWSIAPELTKAIKRKDEVATMAIIPGFFEKYAASPIGRTAIVALTDGAQCVFYSQDGIRSLAIDIAHLREYSGDHFYKNLAAFILYGLYVVTTCLTAILQANESDTQSGTMHVVTMLLTFLSVYATNRAGALNTIFQEKLPSWSSSPDGYLQNNHYVKQKNAREEKLEAVSSAEKAYYDAQSNQTASESEAPESENPQVPTAITSGYNTIQETNDNTAANDDTSNANTSALGGLGSMLSSAGDYISSLWSSGARRTTDNDQNNEDTALLQQNNQNNP